MYKKVFFYVSIILLFTSCAGTFDSVKRGLTGAKQKSTDEFLIQKKDPLILPPDYENLPTPDNTEIAKEEISSFEKTLTEDLLIEDNSSQESSAESSILKKIRKK